MSNNGPPTGVGRTLAGGVQDVAAILPLIGTEQCEKHTGSALKGGYLYAAAAPLSIFGSLGIVKAGIAVLVSSISISIPHLSFSFSNYKPSVKYSGQQKWLGGRMLKDAGFELTGVVAPLIGMDGHRFKAETRLVEMLEEKHIDDAEKITIDWKSREWNIMLFITTILGAALSLTPYIALLHGPASWQPNTIHLPWLFPALRIVGSSTAAITCQFIIQSRVITLMKNRIIFMIIHRRFNISAWLKDGKLKWGENLPAEQCIWSLEQYLLSSGQIPKLVETAEESREQTAVQDDPAPLPTGDHDHVSVPITSLPENHDDTFNIDKLRKLQREHFPTSTRDTTFTTLSWILLGLSLPATVAGYIGCFTLVGATPAQGSGPLVWVGLEAALSILRIFVWASNPSFDEETDITLGLKLSEHQPLVTTDDYNPSITNLNHPKRKPFTLVPEREFLEHITPFTGPLDQFRKADGLSLYFTLTTNYPISSLSSDDDTKKSEPLCLLMTLFDINMDIAVTIKPVNNSFHYFDSLVKYNAASRKLEADIHSEKMEAHPWRAGDNNLFDSLIQYHKYLVGSFSIRVTTLTATWDLLQNTMPENHSNVIHPCLTLPSVTSHDQAYLDRGYEHALKTDLVANWGEWIVNDMSTIRSHTHFDCQEALRDLASKKAKWELTEWDVQHVYGWAIRELVLLTMSLELEGTLHSKMETCISKVSGDRQDQQLRRWMDSEFESGWRERMDQERRAAKKRMEKASKDASEQAEKEGRPWGNDDFSPLWTKAIQFIDSQWSSGINNQWKGLTNGEYELEEALRTFGWMDDSERDNFVEQFNNQISHKHWHPQLKLEEDIMRATIEHIHTLPADSPRSNLAIAYKYPGPDDYATTKFAFISNVSSNGKVCLAKVYSIGTLGLQAQVVYDVIAKSTTCSVVNVDPEIVSSIPPNDHLLFLHSTEAKEPAFVQQNRDRWWDQQTQNASLFYFTPSGVYSSRYDGASCWVDTKKTIAHILVFLTTPSTVQVSVLHYQTSHGVSKLSIQENGQELGIISNIPSDFQLGDFQSFVLCAGRHELELVPIISGLSESEYHLRDIFITISNTPTGDLNLSSMEVNQEGLVSVQDPEAGLSLDQVNMPTSQTPQSPTGNDTLESI